MKNDVMLVLIFNQGTKDLEALFFAEDIAAINQLREVN